MHLVQVEVLVLAPLLDAHAQQRAHGGTVIRDAAGASVVLLRVLVQRGQIEQGLRLRLRVANRDAHRPALRLGQLPPARGRKVVLQFAICSLHCAEAAFPRAFVGVCYASVRDDAFVTLS